MSDASLGSEKSDTKDGKKEKEKIKIFERSPVAGSGGGWVCQDKKALKEQRGIIWDVIKQATSNLLSGVDLMKTAFPVHINQPRSYLEMIADGWCYAPVFLKKAAEETDPVERFKWVMCFAIGGLQNTCTLQKPFNPILGETYQASFDDGTLLYCEQSSHHPPITAWEVIGPNNAWKLYGYGEWGAQLRTNSIKGYQKGPHFIEFPDGTKIEYDLLAAIVGGLGFGDRTIDYEGTMHFTDKKNNLTAEIVMPIPQNSGFLGGWFSSNKQKVPSDHFIGSIQKNGSGVSRIEGCWLGGMDFDGKRYWTYTDKFYTHRTVADPLQSDSSKREDLVAVKAGDFKTANEAKGRLEEKQRRDAKMRKEKREARGESDHKKK